MRYKTGQRVEIRYVDEVDIAHLVSPGDRGTVYCPLDDQRYVVIKLDRLGQTLVALNTRQLEVL